MPHRSHLNPSTRAVAACAILVSAASCGGYGAVDVDPFTTEDGTAGTCSALLEDLPQVVDDAVRRDVSPAHVPAAAWGQPAIVLRCGVPMPAEYAPDAQLFDMDGIGWLPVEVDGGALFTSVDREVLVEVAIPDDYEPAADVLADLTDVVTEHLPERPFQ